MCLGPKEAVFEKPEELSQYLKTLYIRGNPMEVRGVISMELTMGRKSLATMFFIIEVKGNYSVILGRDWIHANHCIPSTLHHQWINDEIEAVHADVLAYIALVTQ
jgi:hypothetical protein